MFDKAQKPKLSTDQQIKHLSSKGITFNLISKEDAREYLSKNNNYFKLCAYRKNFPKYSAGEKKDQYINLDFAMLKDLAIIDMRLRYILIHLTLDIEHFVKIKLLMAIDASTNDGYQIVNDYIEYLRGLDEEGTFAKKLELELERNNRSPYCGELVNKYNKCYPIWVFVEIISFGSLINFYEFCVRKLSSPDLKKSYLFFLKTTRQLRNAVAHNNCIIHNMGSADKQYYLTKEQKTTLRKIYKTTKNIDIENEIMRQVFIVLNTHYIFVKSEGVHSARADELNGLVKRMYKNIDYYSENETILNNFDFLNKTIKYFFDFELTN